MWRDLVINAVPGIIFPTWEAQPQRKARGCAEDLWHGYIGVASRQRHGIRRSERRGGVSGLLWHMEGKQVADPGRSGPLH